MCERRRGRRRGAREGACREGATTLQSWILRLICNADAFAATRPTLLFRPMYNAARLNRNALSDRVCYDGSPVAMKCAVVSRGGCGHNGGEKRNALIVSVMLPVRVNFALRSHTQRRRPRFAERGSTPSVCVPRGSARGSKTGYVIPIRLINLYKSDLGL